jgi:hypothetical protein
MTRSRDKGTSVVLTLVVAGLTAVFALFLPMPVLHGLALLLPSETVPASIVERERRETFAYRPRMMPGQSVSQSVTLELADGVRVTVDAGSDLYALAAPGGTLFDDVALERTRPLGLPVALIVQPRPLVTPTPGGVLERLLPERAPAPARRLDLTPPPILSLGALALNGLMGWVVWRTTERSRRMIWPLFWPVVAAAVALGTLWMLP